MRYLPLISAALLLGACNVSDSANVTDSAAEARTAGRYQGIGVFDARNGWTRMVAEAKPSDARATLKDDDHVIVVVDSHTGEVRQCGDYSGYCVAMNPWKGELPAKQQLPVELLPVDKNGNVVDPSAAANVAEE